VSAPNKRRLVQVEMQLVTKKKRRARPRDNDRNTTKTVVIAVAILTAAVGLLGLGLWCFKKPAVIEVPVPSAPKIETVREKVRDTAAEERLKAEVERLQQEKKAREAEEERKQIDDEERHKREEAERRLRTAPVPGPWDRVWTPTGLLRALPAFQIVGTGGPAITGAYIPANERGPFPFTATLVSDAALRFEVTDPEGRHLWFEMTFRPSRDRKSTVAGVTMWRLAEDVTAEIARVNKQSMPPQQRRVILAALQVELKRAGTKIDLGVFRGAKDPGQTGK
jgi:hypothetical protein